MQNKINLSYAIRTALAGTTTAVIFIISHMKNGHWAAIATILTMKECIGTQNFLSTLIKGKNLILGAIIGLALGALGFYLMNVVASDGYLWLIYFVIFLILVISLTINQKYSTLSLTPTCSLMIMYLGLTDSVSYAVYERSIEICVGVIVAITFNLMIWPSKNNKKLDNLIHNIIKINHNNFAHNLAIINGSNITKKQNKKDITANLQQFKDLRQHNLKPFYNKDKQMHYELIEAQLIKLIELIYQTNKTLVSLDISYIALENLAMFKYELFNINQALSDIGTHELEYDKTKNLIAKIEDNFVDYSNPEQNTAQMILANNIAELKRTINKITEIITNNN
tara:strand:+ start:3569 stop:4585 length:1017 start_codon:yes stop_codon:yes gene_type:complete